MTAEEEPSRAAGGCALVVLAGLTAGVAFAIDQAVGILAVVLVAWLTLWRSARRMSVSSATPPPGEPTPLIGESAVQELADGTTLTRREGLLIYRKADPGNPRRTTVRVEQLTDEAGTHAT